MGLTRNLFVVDVGRHEKFALNRKLKRQLAFKIENHAVAEIFCV